MSSLILGLSYALVYTCHQETIKFRLGSMACSVIPYIECTALFTYLFFKSFPLQYVSVSKFMVGLQTCLQQDLSEPQFYDDFVYKFIKNVGRPDFSDQLTKE